MKILVTGSRGFTGRYLLPILQQYGYETIELSADLTDTIALTQEIRQICPDYIIHLAALSFVAHTDQQAMYAVNVCGTLNLLQALQDAGIRPKKILIASSANVYGNPLVSPVTEAVCPQPVNHYANSKLAMEHMVRTWFDVFPVIITRPFNYTGIGQDEKFLIPKIIAHYKRKEAVIELGNLEIIRDFSDVRNVVQIYTQLLSIRQSGIVVNVCSGKGIALKEILAFMDKIAGYKPQLRVNTDLVRKNEIHQLVGDGTQLSSLIGKISCTDFVDTLTWMWHG